MGNATTKTYTVNWTGCSGMGCDPFPNQTSTATFCVINNGRCDEICLTLDYPPSCLICLPFPTTFMNLAVSCNPDNTYSFTSSVNGIDWQVISWISGDPKLSITCTDPNTGDSYNCVGDIN